MGQTSRVDSVFMAIKRSGPGPKGGPGQRRLLPKADNIALAKKAGIKAIIQPGGSVADDEVIKACDARVSRWSSRASGISSIDPGQRPTP